MRVKIDVIGEKNRLSKSGELPLTIRLTQNKRRRYIRVGNGIKPEYWDEIKNRVKFNFPDREYIESIITSKLGNPIYFHSKEDKNSYRFILGNLVINKLCTISELHESLGEARKNIERYAKTFREKGGGHSYVRKETRGQCNKNALSEYKNEVRNIHNS